MTYPCSPVVKSLGRYVQYSVTFAAAGVQFEPQLGRGGLLKESLWSPYGIGQTIIFLPCGYYLSFFFSSPNLSGRRLDVYHTSTHGVALVRI